MRLHAWPEEMHLPPAWQSRVVALLAVLHRLELRLARGLDRAHELRSRGDEQEEEREQDGEQEVRRDPAGQVQPRTRLKPDMNKMQNKMSNVKVN